MKQSLSSCYSNGVKVVNTAPGSSNILLTIYKNGVECATLEPGFTYKDASGKVLGTITIESNGDQTLTCTGEPSETLPADCPLIPCDSGTCN